MELMIKHGNTRHIRTNLRSFTPINIFFRYQESNSGLCACQTGAWATEPQPGPYICNYIQRVYVCIQRVHEDIKSMYF